MPGARQRLLLGTTGLLLLAGCSGTPFGDQLSRSFSNPGPTAPTGGSPARPAATPAAPAAPTAANQPAKSPTAVDAKGAAANAPAAPAQAAKPAAPASTLQPAPYRVTIKLPSADPSAPAEVVTQALRAAGVSFEVEMIERVRGNGAPAAPAPPVVTPAPAPR
ncbi:hypothetical protein NZK27_00035 [Synechococcus sp. FGCU-3]|nr:hypothetical protein [Synechococcus sp. FGCU3]